MSIGFRWIVLLVLSLTVLSSGCTRTQSERGVEPAWKSLAVDALAPGTTTKAEILSTLGPPSQVITREEGEIFYYLHEESVSRGLILVFYNTSHINTRYDRAIFFFDGNGVLEDYSLGIGNAGE